jgi:hypothetical protein
LKLSQTQINFIRQYTKALESGDAGLFAGAGLSRSAGYVDWRVLLRDIARDLRLDINREQDLVAIAQYHVNEKKGRARINQVLIDELTKDSVLTANHSIIARLPIETIWTTNYDKLIEQSITEAGKIVDVKLSQENLATSIRQRDAILYKMHGCISQPHDAIVTKDDYEQFDKKRGLFSESLKGDLIRKTFLFVGFSFTDPNIEYVFSRVRSILGENRREHFCIIRQPPRPLGLSGVAKADFEYEKRKMELRISDLQRFGVEAVLINDYGDLEILLRALAAYANRKNIFVSGSANDYGPFGKARLDNFVRSIGRDVITKGYNLVSGFGFGLGQEIVLGALDALYTTAKGQESNRLTVRPFPRNPNKSHQSTLNRSHREDLLSRVGCVIVVAGNKNDGKGGVMDASGVLEEVEIALRLGKFVIPVGSTGFVAKNIWEDAIKSPNKYFPGLNVKTELNIIGNDGNDDSVIRTAIWRILEKIQSAIIV